MKTTVLLFMFIALGACSDSTQQATSSKLEAWGRFHDQFLSFGSPPIPLVRRQMLGEDYNGDSALLSR